MKVKRLLFTNHPIYAHYPAAFWLDTYPLLCYWIL